MDLFIQIDVESRLPTSHPYLGQNLRDCGIDTDNLPAGFVPFVRNDPRDTPMGIYEVLVEQYIWDQDQTGMRDNWHAREMTPKEHDAKRAILYAADHPDDHVFDEETGVWKPDLNGPGSPPDVEE